jgi:hypothetical protein
MENMKTCVVGEMAEAALCRAPGFPGTGIVFLVLKRLASHVNLTVIECHFEIKTRLEAFVFPPFVVSVP